MGSDLKKDETKEKYCTLSRVSGMGGYREGGVQVSAKEVAEVCAAFSARGLVAKSVAGDCCAVEHYADVVGICYHPGDGMGGEPSEYVQEMEKRVSFFPAIDTAIAVNEVNYKM